MPKPPIDDDSQRWSELLQQVNDALLDASMDDPDMREAILSGVRDAMDALLPTEEEDEPPAHPHIRILHPDDDLLDEDDDEDDEDEDDDSESVPVTSVRVHALRRVPALSGEEGILHLPSGGTQLVLRARQPWMYRLLVDAGELTVVMDGEALGTLSAGQTLDVEGQTLQVQASGAARGRYRRL